jgi:hypothetical protein
MVQQLKLACVDCGSRAFYGSARGPLCNDHRRGNTHAREEAASKISGKEKIISKEEIGQPKQAETSERRAPVSHASYGGAASNNLRGMRSSG